MSSARAVMRKVGKTPSLYLCLLALIVWGPPSETAKEAIVLSCEGEWNMFRNLRSRLHPVPVSMAL